MQTKRSYTMPQLRVHGTIRELTQASNKDLGSPSDGCYFRTLANPLKGSQPCSCD